MKSKTSLFNRTVFWNTLQRYWLVFAVYTGILGFGILPVLTNALQNHGRDIANLHHYASLLRLLQDGIPVAILMAFFAAPVIAALLFSFLYNARYTGMMASLPVKRESMFLSVSAAAVAGITVCNLLILLLALVLELVYGQVHAGALGILFAVLTMNFLIFFGMAVFCCMLTGNILAGPAVYLIFNFLTVGVETLVYGLAQQFVYGMSYYDIHTIALAPVMNIFTNVHMDIQYQYDLLDQRTGYTWTMEGMEILAVYAVVGLVLLGLSMLLYKNRRMETAGDTIAIEILKPIFRICMTIGGGLLFAMFVMQLLYQITPTHMMAAAYIAVLLIVGGVLGYFVAQMLITKTVNVFRRGWKTVGIYAVCVLAIVFSMECNLFGYETYVPDAADVDNVYISLSDGQNNLTFEEEENIAAVVQLHSNILANRPLHEAEYGSPHAKPVDLSEPGAEFRKTNFQIWYTMKDGSPVKRRYGITWTPDEIRNNSSEIRSLERLINTDEAIACRYLTDFPVTVDNIGSVWLDYSDKTSFESTYYHDLSIEDAVELYNECIVPDIADGNLGYIHLIENDEYAKSKYRCTIAMDVFNRLVNNSYGGRSYEDFRNVQLYLTLDAERTVAFLNERGIYPATVYDADIASGFDYSDLGRYKVDDGTVADDILYRDGEITKEAAIGIIGGADGPTAVYVTD